MNTNMTLVAARFIKCSASHLNYAIKLSADVAKTRGKQCCATATYSYELRRPVCIKS